MSLVYDLVESQACGHTSFGNTLDLWVRKSVRRGRYRSTAAKCRWWTRKMWSRERRFQRALGLVLHVGLINGYDLSWPNNHFVLVGLATWETSTANCS
jgi:hypothetical protein